MDKVGALQDVHGRLMELRERAESDEGDVTVEVDSSGAMTGLWLSENATRMRATALGKLIVQTAEIAANRAESRRIDVMNSLDAAIG